MPTIESTSEDTRVYEVCVLFPFPMNQKEEKDAQKEVEGYFEEVGAKQVAKDAWGRRGLAYKIGGYTEGSFVVYYYEMDPSKLKEVDQNLRISKNVLRHMTVKPPKGYQIVNYSEKYEQWLQDKEVQEEERKKKKEEDLKKKMLEKQKRQSTKAEPETAAKEVEATDETEITAEIDKLIADDDLEI